MLDAVCQKHSWCSCMLHLTHPLLSLFKRLREERQKQAKQQQDEGLKRDMEKSQVPEGKKVSTVVCGNTSPQQLTLEELGVPEYEMLKGKVSLRGLWSCVGMAPTARCIPAYRSDVTQGTAGKSVTVHIIPAQCPSITLLSATSPPPLLASSQ